MRRKPFWLDVRAWLDARLQWECARLSAERAFLASYESEPRWHDWCHPMLNRGARLQERDSTAAQRCGNVLCYVGDCIDAAGLLTAMRRESHKER